MVVFSSSADNLVPGDTNGNSDVFVRNLKAGGTARVSLGVGGAQGDGNSSDPSLSSNGRVVAFHSQASNLVAGDTNGLSDIFVHDLKSGVTTRGSVGADGAQGNDRSEAPFFSPNGRTLGFLSEASNFVEGDTNEQRDVFVVELE